MTPHQTYAIAFVVLAVIAAFMVIALVFRRRDALEEMMEESERKWAAQWNERRGSAQMNEDPHPHVQRQHDRPVSAEGPPIDAA